MEVNKDIVDLRRMIRKGVKWSQTTQWLISGYKQSKKEMKMMN
ncbi:hypothetical protein GCM10025794_31990 [Massilia kyonggiensis]